MVRNNMTTQALKNWQKYKLGDLAQDVRQLYTPTKDEKLPYVGLEHIEQQTLHLSGVGQSNETESTKKIFKSGDVLFGTLRPYFRKVTRPKFNGVCSTDIAVIRPTKNSDGNFLKYFIANQDFIDHASNISSGTRMPRINWKVLKNQVCLFPKLTVQKEIGDILVAYDDLIENNTRRIQILEQMAQAIYTEWFDSLASSWKIMPLRDVIKSYIGGGWGKEDPDKKYSGSAYVIRGTDIPKASVGDVSTCPLRYHTPSNLKNRVLQDGDLVFEVSGGSKGQPVGRSLLVTSKFLDQFNQNIICASFCKLIRPDQNKISPFQLYEQILSWYAIGIIEKYQVQSTGISNFRFESFIDEEKVALPSQEVRDKFDDIVSPLFDEIYSLGNRNQNLRQTRDLLLPKLVNGEIRV